MKEKTTKLTVVKDGVESETLINKPTPEETVQYKLDYENAGKAFSESMWAISEPGVFGANDVGMFLLEYLDKYAFWQETQWIGVLKLNEVIRKQLALVDENTPLQLDYHGLEFCGYMLSRTGGIGLQAAVEFEKIADKYAKIGIVVGEQVENARTKVKEIQYLQEKWAAAEQGFHLAELEASIKDEQESVKEDLPTDEKS